VNSRFITVQFKPGSVKWRTNEKWDEYWNQKRQAD
jgi:hypothetical protein